MKKSIVLFLLIGMVFPASLLAQNSTLRYKNNNRNGIGKH